LFRTNRGRRREPSLLRSSSACDGLLAGTCPAPESRISRGAVEGDRITKRPPRNTKVAAEIPDLYGPGLTPQMTYYETKRGAQVFAARAFGLTGAVSDPRVSRLLTNLWRRMAGPTASEKSLPQQPGTLMAPLPIRSEPLSASR